jgi:serine/threonine protein phosphatase PrpC
MTFRWSSEGQTDVGRVRTVNEDALLINDECGLWLVADGMGGHEGGDFASQAVVSAFDDLQAPSSLAQLAASVQSSLDQANRRVLQHAQGNTREGMMGTTVVAFLAHGDFYFCYWCGDSRAYLLRDGRLQRLTRDHSVVQDLVDSGEISPDDVESHPASNQITNALGIQEPLQLERVQGQLRDGDIFLVCSDGLFKEVNEAEIAGILMAGAATAVERLVRAALARGARDNTTAIVVQMEETTLVGATQRL